MMGEPSSELQQQWMSAWRAEVRTSPAAIGLFEYPSTRLVEASARAAELLGTTPEAARGLDFMEITDRPEDTAAMFRMMSDGRVQSIQAVRPFPQPDGSVIEARSSGRAIRSGPGPDLGLWVIVANPTSPDLAAASGEDEIETTPRAATSSYTTGGVVLGPSGGGWRVVAADSDAEALLGRRRGELVGVRLADVISPDHIGAALLAVAQATTDASGFAALDVQHGDGSHRRVAATVTMQGATDTPRFEFAFFMFDAPVVLPALDDLPDRQREVGARLARGERVKTIANEMYLSQSTVRNHLTAIFRKFGVHSQHELLTLLRQGSEPPPNQDS
jgi:PAS domain S-box-containing protein